MKQRSFLMRFLAIVLLAGLVACAQPEEPQLIATAQLDNDGETVDSNTEEPAATTETPDQSDADMSEETADLPLLPGLDGSQLANGRGGGGGLESTAAGAPAATDMAADIAIDYVPIDIWEGTEFVLNAELPGEIGRGLVQQQGDFTMTLERARQIADQFGFSGPLYTQPLPEGNIPEAERLSMQQVYTAFDDNGRILNIDAYGVYYSDNNLEYQGYSTMELSQSGPIAEAFLQERGLLDFEYEMRRGWGNEVWFVRVIDGKAVNQPEITVGVTSEGQVIFVSMQKLNNLDTLGNYPLRTAVAAWELIQGGVMANNIAYSYLPNFDEQPTVEPAIVDPFADQYRFWQRQYAAGSEVIVYSWPSIYVAADGSSAPRIEAYPLILQGDTAELQAIADNAFNQFRFTGQVSENGRFLNVESWELLNQEQETLYLQGTVQTVDGQTQFTTDSGDTYILPDAPADLPVDERVNVFAWATRDIGAAYPALDWENIDVIVDFGAVDSVGIEEPIIEDTSLMYDPEPYTQMTVNEVNMVYFYAYIFPEYDESQPVYGPPTIVLKPVWRFAGETNTGEQIELFVDAVDPAFIQPTQ